MRSLHLLSLALLSIPVASAAACGAKADPLADDGAPQTEDGGGTEGSSDSSNDGNGDGPTSTDESGSEPQYPMALWELSFQPFDSGRVHDIDIANGNEVILSLFELGDEGSVDVTIRRLDASGVEIWSTPLPIVGERLCVTPEGSSYHVGADRDEGGEPLEPRVVKIDANGDVAWNVALAPELSPSPQRLGIECKASDDSVLVVGSVASGALLVHLDADGNELAKADGFLPGVTGLESIALRADGQLLVAGAGQSSGQLAVLDAAGNVVESRESAMPSLGPWVASRGTTHAWTALATADPGYEQYTLVMGDDSLTPVFDEPGIIGIPNHMGRGVAVSQEGRVFAVAPSEDDAIRVWQLDPEGQIEIVDFVPAFEGYQPSAIAFSLSDERLFIAGEHAAAGWIAAYEL